MRNVKRVVEGHYYGGVQYYCRMVWSLASGLISKSLKAFCYSLPLQYIPACPACHKWLFNFRLPTLDSRPWLIPPEVLQVPDVSKAKCTEMVEQVAVKYKRKGVVWIGNMAFRLSAFGGR